MELGGIHHITAVTGNASGNVAFYTQVLGLRLTKKTVNQDDVSAYHLFYGDTLKVQCPTGSGKIMTLGEVAQEIGRRLTEMFLPDEEGRRPCHGEERRFIDDPNFRDLVLFYEYFHGDSGRGLGASHQTGWTALVSKLLEAESKVKVAAAKGMRPKHAMA